MNPKRFRGATRAELEAEFQRLGPDTVAAFIAELWGSHRWMRSGAGGHFRRARDLRPNRSRSSSSTR